MGPRHRLLICECKTACLDPERCFSIGPSLHLWFCTFKTVPLYIQNSDFSIRITNLYGSQPSFVAFACKTATLGPEFQVSMGPRPHLWFFAFKGATFAQEFQASMSPNPHMWFCAFTTATL